MAKRPSMNTYHEASADKAAAPKKGKKTLRSVEIEPGENGGHIVTHSYESGDGMYHKPERYPFSNSKDAVAHLTKHYFGGGDED